MEIKTKFNVGDVLFTIKDMHIVSFSVKCVNVFYDKYGKHVYYIEEGELYDSHKEEGCFSSKEGLLAIIQSE